MASRPCRWSILECENLSRQHQSGLSFIGFKSDIDNARWMLDHLADFVHNKLFEFLLDCLAPAGKERKREVLGFVIGCTERISTNLIKMCDQSKAARTPNHNALVVIKDKAIKDFMEAEGICLRTSGGSRAGFSEGARAAEWKRRRPRKLWPSCIWRRGDVAT